MTSTTCICGHESAACNKATFKVIKKLETRFDQPISERESFRVLEAVLGLVGSPTVQWSTPLGYDGEQYAPAWLTKVWYLRGQLEEMTNEELLAETAFTIRGLPRTDRDGNSHLR